MEFEQALLGAQSKYRQMQAQDFVKLAFQSEYGGGHLIKDMLSARSALMDEWETACVCGTLFEDISGGFCRVYLGDVRDAGLSPSTLFRMFIISAKSMGSMDGLNAKLDMMQALAQGGSLSIKATDLQKYISTYKAEGCPMVSHSAIYKEAYKPSYRIVEKSFCQYLQLYISIDRLLRKNPCPIIGIDGNAAAGKTTLAESLACIYPCNLIHADSFFLPMEKRTSRRLAQPGGNIDYERLQDEVLSRLPCKVAFSYRIFSCSAMDFTGEAYIQPLLPVIIEGSYSLHPYFKGKYDLRVIVSIDADTQQKRIAQRENAEMQKRFTEIWIPMENRYFKECAINCDLLF